MEKMTQQRVIFGSSTGGGGGGTYGAALGFGAGAGAGGGDSARYGFPYILLEKNWVQLLLVRWITAKGS